MSTKINSEYDLIARWICPERVYPGDPNAGVAGTGITIWVLVGHWSKTGQDAAATAADYGIERNAVKATILYYRLHRDLIDDRLSANGTATD